MSDWDRKAILEWFKGAAGERIVIEMRGTTLRVEGVPTGVEELDACSTQFHEVGLDSGGEKIDVALSFHESTLSVHVMIHGDKPGTASLSIPVSIPHSALILKNAAREAEKADSEEEPVFSPYVLLH